MQGPRLGCHSMRATNWMFLDGSMPRTAAKLTSLEAELRLPVEVG